MIYYSTFIAAMAVSYIIFVITRDIGKKFQFFS